MSIAPRLPGHLLVAFLAAASGSFAGAELPAQAAADDLDRLRRDQEEILRKAERLQALMERLLERYQREGKQEQVKLLQEGLAHLERAGIVREVADIRDHLGATAFNEALRKQREVVENLERLLNILLERNSVENLDQQVKAATEQALSARDLEQRQRDLQREIEQALRRDPSPAEQAMVDALRELARAEAAEAERNARLAGTRRPFLESALQRVQELLRQQDRLERSLADEAAGRQTANRQREFDLGDLLQRARELAGQVRDQDRQGELRDAAQALRDAAQGNDAQARQQTRDRLDALLQNPPRLPGTHEGPQHDPEWASVREQLQHTAAGDSAPERQQMQDLAETAQKLGGRRATETGARNAENAERLQRAARELADRLQREAGAEPAKDPAMPPAEAADPAASLRTAAEKLQEAGAAARSGDAKAAQAKVDEAMSALERAREQNAALHPDAANQADRMAAESSSAAKELENAPSAQAAEQTAAEQLQNAERALRQTADGIEKARDEGGQPRVDDAAATARQQLERARDTLQRALGAATEGSRKELQAAAERQREIEQQAGATAARMQQETEAGRIGEAQARAAGEQIARARQHMQSAAEKLQSGQQAGAAVEQQRAAEALQAATEQMQDNQRSAAETQQALQARTERQQQIADDIMRLAEEVKQRPNKAAERALQDAADAARKAQRAMEQGDAEETERQQENAREKLQEAAEQLEEERDRYQDLRQEELLFKMKDELTSFLAKQRPITAQTLEAQAAAQKGALSRPARLKLNQLGEAELELAGRIEFLTAALTEEGNLVYRAVLEAEHEDLREVSRRLGGRAPDVGTYTTMLQQDVERRAEELLAALERERKRREERRQQQQQQQQGQGQNRFNPQRERLVSLIAELEMLKQLEIDTARSTNDLQTLIEARSDDVVSAAEIALVERLAHRHAEITLLFQQIKAGVEETLKAMQGGDGAQPEHGGGRRGR